MFPMRRALAACSMGRAVGTAMCAIALIVAVGCLGPVIPLYPPGPGDPSTPVWVVDHGWHAGLAVERAAIPPGLWPEQDDLAPAPYLEVGVRQLVRKRAGWLTVLFLGQLLTATAMAYYEDAIARAVVLALFIPLIISSGGNSGSQASTLVIRALAMGEVRLRDWWRVFVRELGTSFLLGAILGLIGLLRIVLWPTPELLLSWRV